MSQLSNNRQTTSGFTLIELLVVIAIIAILASLLLPALSRAKDSAKRVACMNNQRQLYLGWAMYTHDNNGFIPRNELTGGYDPLNLAWVSGMMCYENDIFQPKSRYGESTNVLLLVPGNFGSIGPYVGASGAYRCPADSSWIEINGARHSRVRSYSMNEKLGLINGFPDSDYYRYKTFTQEQELSAAGVSIYIFLDEHEDTIWDGVFGFPNFDKLDGAPSSRHSRGAVLSFTDGSVLLRKWKDPRTSPPIIRKRQFGESLPNNIDYSWLRFHGSVPQ
jgi:prepilin-type N-terminal cleavage/methylation domain-containing protein